MGSTPSHPTPIITFEMGEGFVKCKEDHCAWGLLREISFDRVHMEVKYLEINTFKTTHTPWKISMCLQRCAYLSVQFECLSMLTLVQTLQERVVHSRLILTLYNYKLLECWALFMLLTFASLTIPHRTPGTEQAKCLPVDMGCTLEFLPEPGRRFKLAKHIRYETRRHRETVSPGWADPSSQIAEDDMH